mgnify:CR=1 FL=1
MGKNKDGAKRTKGNTKVRYNRYKLLWAFSIQRYLLIFAELWGYYNYYFYSFDKYSHQVVKFQNWHEQSAFTFSNFLLFVGLERTGHMSFLTGQDRAPTLLQITGRLQSDYS